MAPYAGPLPSSPTHSAGNLVTTPPYALRRDRSLGNPNRINTDFSLRHQSLLPPTSEDRPLDLLCIGFGPASLGIAVALHDFLERSKSPPELAGLNGRPPNVAFLEKQHQFAWHAGMLLPGTKMQISFLKDLATIRNPQSEFTFLNYLHKNDRLVPFINLGTFLPQRVEYEDYMRWCASWFEDIVQYDREVVSIAPHKPRLQDTLPDYSGLLRGPVEYFDVTTKDAVSGQHTTYVAKNVVIAAGGQPNIPPPFPQNDPLVVHSSQFNKTVGRLLPEREAPYRVAVVGAGQSAAEIFSYLHQFYPNSRTKLLIRGSALRPSDDSPFVNEIFNPERVSAVYEQDPSRREEALLADRATNYGVVRIELLEHIYETLYTQRLRHRSEDDWAHRILPYRQVIEVTKPQQGDVGRSGPVRLHIQNDSSLYLTNAGPREETMDFDAVFVASGYRRDAHQDMLTDAVELMPKQDRQHGGKWRVGRDYNVIFEEGKVASDAGVWLQGCCEKTHGLSDTLLSIIATRAGELVENMFQKDINIKDDIGGIRIAE